MPKIIEDERIFHAVMNVISQRGYAGATTKQIAKTAGISEITLFRRYGNKQKLLKLSISFFLKKTELVKSAHYTGYLREDLLRIVKAYQESAWKYGNFFSTLFMECSQSPSLFNLLSKPIEVFLAFRDLIRRYQEEKLLKQEHPLHTLAALIGPLMNTHIYQSIFPNGEMPLVDPQAHVDLFLKGRINT